MNIKQWAEKFAAGIYDWVSSVDDNLLHLDDLDESYKGQAKEESEG